MTNNTQFDHQDGGRNRKPGQRSRMTKLTAIGIVGAFLALGTLITFDAADAAGYSQRNRAAHWATATTPRRTRPMGSVHAFPCTRTTWSRATGSSAAIRIRSSAARSCATTTAAGPTSPCALAHDGRWRPLFCRS